ncbi:MAG TPA: DUF2283 domain-containing protein [Phycisphaerales bacterium]|nr:DUF2283 domain-containing protein [Phycisphaerales bacterium]
MKARYLEITFRKGKPIAAYFYLPRMEGDRSARTTSLGDGLLADFSADGRPIGIEITSPSSTTVETLNRALAALSQSPVSGAEIAPLAA